MRLFFLSGVLCRCCSIKLYKHILLTCPNITFTTNKPNINTYAFSLIDVIFELIYRPDTLYSERKVKRTTWRLNRTVYMDRS